MKRKGPARIVSLIRTLRPSVGQTLQNSMDEQKKIFKNINKKDFNNVALLFSQFDSPNFRECLPITTSKSKKNPSQY